MESEIYAGPSLRQAVPTASYVIVFRMVMVDVTRDSLRHLGVNAGSCRPRSGTIESQNPTNAAYGSLRDVPCEYVVVHPT